MIRRKGPILAAGVIAAFALGWYRGLFGVGQDAPPALSPAGTETAQPQAGGSGAPTAPLAEQAQTAASPPEPSKESQPSVAVNDSAATQQAAPSADPAASAAAQTTPGFDVVRVEPDGSTVVAGKGAANERIALTDGSRTLGEAQTDANGDFVMTLSLPTGSHRLQLAQRDDVLSDDAAVVNVPPPGQPDQLLVMMQRPGEASEVLQKPAEAVVAALPEAPPSVAPERVTEPATVPSQSEAQVAAVSPVPAQPDSLRQERLAGAELSVEAVEIEGDRLYVAGSAKSGSAVRIYLDDQSVVETRSGAGDRFIATARTDVPVGEHTVRADALDAGGRVIARVEVPFQRPAGSSMAAVAAAPQAETAPQAASPETDTAGTPSPGSGTQPAASAAAPPTPDAAGRDNTSPNVAAAESSPAATGDSAVAGPQTVRQAPLQASASRVIIRRGDTLWRISRDTYGRGSRYTVIYLANGDQIRDPDRIYPGQVFRVPDTGEADAPPRG